MKRPLVLALAVTALFAASSVSAGDAEAGKAKAKTVCAACHGPDGISAIPNYPNLKGQKEAYLKKAMNDYKTGARNDPTMSAMATPLTDEDIANLAAYYSSLE
ncbi:MAG: cytochrome c [Chromatiales bacterium]|jgi:cytochrome c553